MLHFKKQTHQVPPLKIPENCYDVIEGKIVSTQWIMAAQLASDSSESEFDEEFSDQESPDYEDIQNKHEILISPAMAYLAFYILFWEKIFFKLKKNKNKK